MELAATPMSPIATPVATPDTTPIAATPVQATPVDPNATASALETEVVVVQTTVDAATESELHAEETVTALQTTVAALEATAETSETRTQEQDDALATTRAELEAAEEEVDRYRATISAATPMAAESPSPVLAPTPSPTPISYEASLATNFEAWPLPDGWSRNGGLKTDGGNTGWVLAPIPVPASSDYAVEVVFQVEDSDTCPRNFGIAIRGSDAGYYAGGIEWGCDPAVRLWASQNVLAEQSIDLSEGPHLLRVEAIGDRVSIALDGVVIVSATDGSVPAGGQVALWSNGVPITITSVKIIEIQGSAEHAPQVADNQGVIRDEETDHAPAA